MNNVTLPANAMILFENLISVVTFDVASLKQDVGIKLMNTSSTMPFNDNFEKLGNTSSGLITFTWKLTSVDSVGLILIILVEVTVKFVTDLTKVQTLLLAGIRCLLGKLRYSHLERSLDLDRNQATHRDLEVKALILKVTLYVSLFKLATRQPLNRNAQPSSSSPGQKHMRTSGSWPTR